MDFITLSLLSSNAASPGNIINDEDEAVLSVPTVDSYSPDDSVDIFSSGISVMAGNHAFIVDFNLGKLPNYDFSILRNAAINYNLKIVPISGQDPSTFLIQAQSAFEVRNNLNVAQSVQKPAEFPSEGGSYYPRPRALCPIRNSVTNELEGFLFACTGSTINRSGFSMFNNSGMVTKRGYLASATNSSMVAVHLSGTQFLIAGSNAGYNRAVGILDMGPSTPTFTGLRPVITSGYSSEVYDLCWNKTANKGAVVGTYYNTFAQPYLLLLNNSNVGSVDNKKMVFGVDVSINYASTVAVDEEGYVYLLTKMSTLSTVLYLITFHISTPSVIKTRTIRMHDNLTSQGTLTQGKMVAINGTAYILLEFNTSSSGVFYFCKTLLKIKRAATGTKTKLVKVKASTGNVYRDALITLADQTTSAPTITNGSPFTQNANASFVTSAATHTQPAAITLTPASETVYSGIF